ncbi:7-cyano-7-deazaguanine synthase, partial [ANME-1 cluster archaeon GoMg1]|nr:7-cyano-7-deazaguanine synthase [ANME-1 cluster archaeon GoMg1]
KAPLHLTYSCYLGDDKHCGVCESCLHRRRGFKEAGVDDPTEYIFTTEITESAEMR